MKIAIIGSGIAGLTTAHHLHRRHAITLFETQNYLGGHTNTITIEERGIPVPLDTGFIVFNERNYPNFIRLLSEIGVASQPSTMSFSVRCDRSGLEYNGGSFNQLFAQRRNLFSPGFHRMLRDIVRFRRSALALLDQEPAELTLAEYLRKNRFSREFVRHYLVPLTSAIWSCPENSVPSFPMRFLIGFLRNHGMLDVFGRPVWRVVRGGSKTYVEALTRGFRDRIRLTSPIERVLRTPQGVVVTPRGSTPEGFDHVVFACHSDQALALLEDPTPAERDILGAIPFQPNEAILHTDTRALPRSRRAWASWNYRLPSSNDAPVSITYNLNILQNLSTESVYCVTLNDDSEIEPDKILRRICYHHPVYTPRTTAAQARHHELIGANRTSYCGAYWGYGFHEDGVKSALAVCQALREERVHA